MQYRKLKGTALFDGQQLWEDHVLVLKNEEIKEIVPYDKNDDSVEKFEGILSPGFINAHCHLELSHMKGLVPEGTGLVDFLITVVKSRNDATYKESAIRAAEAEMFQNGISGVADICNTTDTVGVKKQSLLRWHNLVEVINFDDANLEKALSHYREVKEAYDLNGLTAVLTPHAPYSVSAGTYDAINRATEGAIISMHNQESEAEDALFKKGGGDFLRLFTAFGDGNSPFPVTGRSSLQSWLPHFTAGQTIILVHNTFTTEEDIVFAKEHAARYGLRLVYCLCPNANRYIENALPPVDRFIKHDCFMVIGTDSYSSNHQLSVAAEVRTLKSHFPQLSLSRLLQWATANGADALGWKGLGKFSKSSKPGVVLLDENDFSVRRLV